MNTGQPVEALVQDILRTRDLKHDYVAPTNVIMMDENNQIILDDEKIFQPNNLFHDQVASHLNVPKKFYDRLRTDHPDLLQQTFNTLMHEKRDSRLIRTIDKTARAFLSDRFRRLDNDDIAAFMLPMIQNNNLGLNIESAYVNERKLFFQVVSERLKGEVRVGDTVQAGFIISNSEVGLGALSVQPLLYRLVCRNGAVINELAKRQTHLGQQFSFDADYEIMGADTIEASNRALMLQLRDYLGYVMSEDGFNKMIETVKEGADDPVRADPTQVVEALGKSSLFSEDENKNILYAFLQGNDFTRWGLANAVTQAANEHSDYERAVELEKLGGKILTMPKREFIHIAAGV